MTLSQFLALALQALAVAVGVAPFVVPLVAPLVWGRLTADRRARVLAVTRGIAGTVGHLASGTPTTVDDDVARVLHLVEAELGRLDDASRRQAAGVVRALHADPAHPLGLGGVGVVVEGG